MKQKDAQNSKEQDLTLFKLFSFSDYLDKILIIIGICTALVAALMHPVIFFLYGRIAKTFVDIQNSKLVRPNVSISFNETVINLCVKVEANADLAYDFDERIDSTIKWYIIISFISLVANYLSNVCLNTSAERQIKRIRQRLFVSIVRQDISFFDKNTPGELNSIVISNIETLKTTLSYKFSEFITLLCRGLACTLFAVFTAWKFTLIFLAIVPLLIITLNVMIRMIKKYTIEEFKAYGSAGKISQEILSAIRTVISFNNQKKAINSYSSNLTNAESIAIKKGLLKGILDGLFNFLFNTLFGIALVYATYLARNECSNYNAGNLMSAFFCLVASTFSIGQAVPFLGDVAQSKGAAKKLFEIIQTKSQIDVFKSNDKKKIKNLTGQIEFENVCFSYPQRPETQILNNLSLKIPAGKTVAFCGSSGCGKSTTVGLLQRFYLPNSGKIKIDNHDIEDLDLEWLRNQMALVSQEPILFTTTIKENIRLGRLDATDNEIEQAAKMANAHDFIMKSSSKYDTHVGERGSQLSGGQKQRIAIARALLRNPKILLLDEATSALDNQSEQIVQDALDKAKIGRTTLIIAHRLSTIRNADLIVAFDKGQVREIGTHDELIILKGLYYDLVTSQIQDKNEIKDIEVVNDDSSESESELDDKANQVFIRIPSLNPKVEYNVIARKHKGRGLFRYELKLWKFQKAEFLWIILGVLAQMVTGAIFPLISLVFSQIYSIFSIQDYSEQLNQSLKMMTFILGLAAINFISSFCVNYSLAICGAKLTTKIRVKMFESMLRQEISFHDMDQNRSSILSSQLAANAPLCKGLTSDKLGLLCQGFSGVGLAIIVSFYLNWKLALVMLIFVPITFFSGVIAGRSSTNTKVKGKTSIEEGGRLITETVENIRTVVSLNRENYFIDEFRSIFDLKFKKTLALLHLQAFSYSVSNTMIFFVQITAFSFGYYLIKNDNLKVSELYTVYAAMTFSSLVLGRVYSQLPDQNKARQSAKTAFKIINRKSNIDSMSEDGIRPLTSIGNIEFKNVCFEYPTRPDHRVLQNFNLSVKNGQSNALVGTSGCGKSTNIALLLRFYDPTHGSILLDGVDIKKLNIQWLRSQIGIVSQEPVLFDYSIRENIENGDTNRQQIPIEEVVEVSTQANINSRIESLPDVIIKLIKYNMLKIIDFKIKKKYETLVGTKGSQLSGGEKQRIAIARALIRKPKILLLDEATSALDTASEQIVQDALEKACAGRTCIVIAHRLSTIQNCNKISVVKDGSVVEEGSHAALIQAKNIYYKLYNQNNQNKSL